MKNLFRQSLLPLFFLTLFFSSCDKEGHINILSIEEDKKLGAQVSNEIESDPTTYPILSKTDYPKAYEHIERITNTILNSGNVTYKDEFAWQVKIIKNDSTLNAFATPGGYIYVYTGLIKYLDTEDQLAGVMGHEIAHADKRHTSRNITKQYGLDVVLQVIIGKNQTVLTQIAKGLAGLSYSRDFEREADNFSVVYLQPTSYQCNGAAGFFEKMTADGGGGRTPEFLSTHPNPDNRIEAINNKATELACKKAPLDPPSYDDFKASLP